MLYFINSLTIGKLNNIKQDDTVFKIVFFINFNLLFMKSYSIKLMIL